MTEQTGMNLVTDPERLAYAKARNDAVQRMLNDPEWFDATVPVRRFDLWALYGTLFHTDYQASYETDEQREGRYDRLCAAIVAPAVGVEPGGDA